MTTTPIDSYITPLFKSTTEISAKFFYKNSRISGIFFNFAVLKPLTMDIRKKYRIPYTGLKEGKHTFEFAAAEEFFEHYKYEYVNHVELKATIELQKMSTMMILDLCLEGNYTTQCDQCGDDLVQDFTTEQRLYVKFGEEESTDENILILPQSEHELHMAEYIFEFFVTSVQARHIHNEGDCNQKVIEKIKEYKVNEQEETSNPIWDKLKELKK